MQKKTKRVRSLKEIYSFKGKLWKHKSQGGWHFVTLPSRVSKKIRSALGTSEEGWGRLKTVAQIKGSSWQTAIWFDTKADSYLLPVKAAVRRKEKLEVGSSIGVRLEFEQERLIV